MKNESITCLNREIVVLGAGPAGLAAALEAAKNGAQVLIIEREGRAGGILKQCIHDGFGLVRYKEKLTGPEYALRDIHKIADLKIELFTDTFVLDVCKTGDNFLLRCVNESGAYEINTDALIMATGCRERTDRQVFLQGERPSGVYTAGLAQYFVNIEGYLPGKQVVILGSGDIGLIMARRLTLEGAHVVGVFEVKPEPSGLQRNICQCLDDFEIPLHLSKTVTAIHGKDRICGVTVSRVDENGKAIEGTNEYIDCDCLILSVGLIPENELGQMLGVSLDPCTRGPFVDQNMHTLVSGVFACGNSVHVHDLVDYVSESGSIAGRAAAKWIQGKKTRELVPLRHSDDFLYHVPQFLDSTQEGSSILYFRSKASVKNPVRLFAESRTGKLPVETFPGLRPSEMERVELDLINKDLSEFVLGLEALQ